LNDLETQTNEKIRMHGYHKLDVETSILSKNRNTTAFTACGVLEWCQGWRPQKLTDKVVVHQKNSGTCDGGMVEVITVSYNENIVTRTPHRHSAIVEGFRMVGAAGLGKLNCLELEE
jgi:hypothetical protein